MYKWHWLCGSRDNQVWGRISLYKKMPVLYIKRGSITKGCWISCFFNAGSSLGWFPSITGYIIPLTQAHLFEKSTKVMLLFFQLHNLVYLLCSQGKGLKVWFACLLLRRKLHKNNSCKTIFTDEICLYFWYGALNFKYAQHHNLKYFPR